MNATAYEVLAQGAKAGQEPRLSDYAYAGLDRASGLYIFTDVTNGRDELFARSKERGHGWRLIVGQFYFEFCRAR